MSADSYFAIGSTHQVCQDHAISDGDFVVLSDGCSSAKDSDWGARLITRTAYNILKLTKPSNIKTFAENVLLGAVHHVEELELHQDCLAATLLGAYVKNREVNAFIIGDGYIVARTRRPDPKIATRLTVISHVFDTGAPWYPYYNLSNDLKDSYMLHYGHGNILVEKTIFEGNDILFHDEFTCSIKSFNFLPYEYCFPVAEYDLIGISSDGLGSFVQQVKNNTSITNKRIKDSQVIKDLFAFKTVEGQFVHRRCQRFLRDYNTQDIKHTDDFSLGVLHV